MRDSFIFYRSFAEAIKKLDSNEERLAIYEAIIDYALDDKEPDLLNVPAMAYTLIKPQIDANNKKYWNGKKGGRPKADKNQTETKTKPKQNQTKTKPEPNVNENVNVNENENVKSIGRFTPPPLADVQSYFKEKGINDPKEPEKFIDFYTSKGWMVGKNKMKDWKAAVRNWIKGIDKSKVGFNNFDNQRSYDNDELERLLVAN